MLIKMYEDTIAFYKSVPRQQDKCRERTSRQLYQCPLSIDNLYLDLDDQQGWGLSSGDTELPCSIALTSLLSKLKFLFKQSES